MFIVQPNGDNLSLMLSLQVILCSVNLTVNPDHHSFLENDREAEPRWLTSPFTKVNAFSAHTLDLRLMLTFQNVSDTHLIEELTVYQ